MKVLDMHCDTAYCILKRRDQGIHTSLRSNDMMIDLKKMKAADYLLQTFAVFVNYEKYPDVFRQALRIIDVFKQEMAANRDIIAQVYSVEDIMKNLREGKMSALLSIEEGQAAVGDPAYLRILYDLGVRMMTLTWNYENDLAYPNCADSECPHVFEAQEKQGLKEKGLEMIQAMEELGIIIDVSHLSDAGFWDVYRHTRKPFIASHSNARAITGHVRNLTDDMIRAMAERGGVAGLNFCVSFLEPNNVDARYGTMKMMADHLRHMIQVGGEDFPALGSDMDGIDHAPEFKDAAGMVRLAEYLQKDGLTARQVEKIFSCNALRVMREVWK